MAFDAILASQMAKEYSKYSLPHLEAVLNRSVSMYSNAWLHGENVASGVNGRFLDLVDEIDARLRRQTNYALQFTVDLHPSLSGPNVGTAAKELTRARRWLEPYATPEGTAKITTRWFRRNVVFDAYAGDNNEVSPNFTFRRDNKRGISPVKMATDIPFFMIKNIEIVE